MFNQTLISPLMNRLEIEGSEPPHPPLSPASGGEEKGEGDFVRQNKCANVNTWALICGSHKIINGNHKQAHPKKWKTNAPVLQKK